MRGKGMASLMTLVFIAGVGTARAVGACPSARATEVVRAAAPATEDDLAAPAATIAAEPLQGPQIEGRAVGLACPLSSSAVAVEGRDPGSGQSVLVSAYLELQCTVHALWSTLLAWLA